ncbi:MAG: HD domain-containing protein [Alistipes sp.]|nr:HD domain-containing protein [Alistipes sp.]
MHEDLRDYIETEILPRYEAFDAAHRTDHVRTVIEQSMALAARYDADPDMAYTIAAYHDLGLDDGRERHHLRSGELLAADGTLRRWFTEEEINTMREAVEDHRASSECEPRTIYGRIVAEADRCIDVDTVLRRTIRYGLEHYPELDREAQYARCCEHLGRKYAEGGYLRLWIPCSDNARRLEELRALIRRPAELRERFDAIYEQEAGRQARYSD